MPVGPMGERLPYPGEPGFGEPPGQKRSVFGGDIPGPRQMTPEQARIKALMEQLQMGEPPMQTRTPQQPKFSDIPSMTSEQLKEFIKPMGKNNELTPFDIIMNFLTGKK